MEGVRKAPSQLTVLCCPRHGRKACGARIGGSHRAAPATGWSQSWAPCSSSVTGLQAGSDTAPSALCLVRCALLLQGHGRHRACSIPPPHSDRLPAPAHVLLFPPVTHLGAIPPVKGQCGGSGPCHLSLVLSKDISPSLMGISNVSAELERESS